MELYTRNAIEYINDIPVFSDRNTRYIKNYDLISQTHLQTLDQTGQCPWGDNDYTEFATKQYMQYINKYCKDNDYVLDAGLGLGDILYNLNTPNKYGVDISINYLTKVKAHNIDVCLSLLEELPYADNLFDVILCKDVLEHVFDLYGSVSQIIRVLKPGGHLILQVPYNQDLTVYLNYSEFEFVHVRSFDYPALVLLFQKIFNCRCLECNIEYYTKFTNCDIITMVVQKY